MKAILAVLSLLTGEDRYAYVCKSLYGNEFLASQNCRLLSESKEAYSVGCPLKDLEIKIELPKSKCKLYKE